MKKKKSLESHGAIDAGDITFSISADNERKLKALIKYAEMLDFITNADEKLSIDGLINDLISNAMDKKIQQLYKKHGYPNDYDFVEDLRACQRPEDSVAVLQSSEIEAYRRAHDRILAHVPVPDTQLRLPV